MSGKISQAAISDYDIERLVIDLGISSAADGSGVGLGHARAIVHGAIARGARQESPTAPAPQKHEHEWVVGRTPWRLVFDDGGWWCIEESIGFGQWNRHDAPAAATDEFARLAGLTEPEGA